MGESDRISRPSLLHCTTALHCRIPRTRRTFYHSRARGRYIQHCHILPRLSTWELSRMSGTSWQNYVDDHLLSTKYVTKAAISGHDASIWAVSEGFKISSAEVKKLLASFSDSENLAQNGVTVEGVRYIFLSNTDRVIRAKKGTSGVHIMKPVQAIIIGQYEESVRPEQCAAVTEKLGDYLITVGY